jgi:hypothetical protein
MRQVRVGDRVKAFLDPNIAGEVTEIFYKQSAGVMLMVGGVPPVEAYAKVLLPNGQLSIVRTTELSIVDR